MFKKLALKRKIEQCKKNMAKLEKERAESQAKLVDEVLVNHVEPDPEAVKIFDEITPKIDAEREKMIGYANELKALEAKKKA